VSEYQYYEFAALDQALTSRQQAELRAVSTRAVITPTNFVNTYEWGDLNADPRQLVERYFDAFAYLSNWGTHRLMFRVPATLLDEHTAASYCVGDAASAWTTGEHTVVDLVAEDDGGVYEEDWTQGGGEGRLAFMLPARSELVAGGRRLLYLAWLLCVQADEVPDQAVEPPVPPGLGRLDAALYSAARFLRIDEDLIAAAAMGSADDEGDADRAARLRHKLATIREADKDEMLLRVAVGDAQRVQAELLARSDAAVTPSGSSRRTADELVALAQTYRDDRQRAQHRQQAARKAEHDRATAAAREQRLVTLASRQEQAWQQVEDLVAARTAADYDAAIIVLRDLSEISRRDNQTGTYERRIAELRHAHRRKATFIDRLEHAGLGRGGLS
jgi:hypothetical protein